MLFLGAYFCLAIKPYIIFSFVPSLVFWIFFTYRDRVKLKFVKVMIGPVVIIVSSIAGYFVVKKLGTEFQQYSIQNAMNTASNFQAYHGFLAQTANASGYHLGEMDGSTGSIIRNIPAAINVTLFRPYIWETRNPVMLLSALESFALMLFTIRIFYRTGIGRTFKAIGSNSTVFFCIFFAMFFGFCVGFTAYNFGALVRYKIPCIPFFVAGLFILNYITEEENKKRLANKSRF
jgi:4-amino-4-deoxy-L-arabinose transferase-like glycosyltransferase